MLKQPIEKEAIDEHEYNYMKSKQKILAKIKARRQEEVKETHIREKSLPAY